MISSSTAAVAVAMQEIPTGHPDCMTNKTLVVTGNLESMTRDEAEDLFKRHGGKTTSSVSGKTTFLLVGQDCGRSKTKSVHVSTLAAWVLLAVSYMYIAQLGMSTWGTERERQARLNRSSTCAGPSALSHLHGMPKLHDKSLSLVLCCAELASQLVGSAALCKLKCSVGAMVPGAVSARAPTRLCFCVPHPEASAIARRQAEDKGTRLIDEDGLISLIKASIPFVKDAPSHAVNGSVATTGVSYCAESDAP